jgi:preprotein translocase subunit SecF
MRIHRFALALVLVAVCVFPILAQSTAAGTDTLSRLLVEVHALRVAMERSAAATPQVQLLASRLTVQNERLTRATHDADTVREELQKTEREAAGLAQAANDVEEALTHDMEPAARAEMKQRAIMIKQQLDASAATEAALRVRETETANAHALEQSQWAELNRRFDELERQLAVRAPQ